MTCGAPFAKTTSESLTRDLYNEEVKRAVKEEEGGGGEGGGKVSC